MGVSTDGQLCYGIPFPEGFELPWGDVSEDEWWRQTNGYKPPFMLYNEEGEHLSGVKPPEALFDQYYEHQHEWDKANPFPVEIVNYCSCDSPMYMVAIKGSLKKNNRGFAEEINPSELTVTDEQKQVLLDFIEKYMKEKIDEHNEDEYDEKVELEPKWYLTSYWG
jgi:hypothetical protein